MKKQKRIGKLKRPATLRKRRIVTAALIIGIVVALAGCKGEEQKMTPGQATKARNIANLGMMAQGKDSLFYYNKIDKKHFLYKADLKGENPQPLRELDFMCLNVIDEILYYIDLSENSNIYRLNPEGGEPELLCGLACNKLLAYNGKLFFNAGSSEYAYVDGKYTPDDYALYSMNYDGTELKEISKGFHYYPYPYNDYVYFTEIKEPIGGQYLYRIDLEGQIKEKISEQPVSQFFIQDDKIYFVSSYEFYKMDLDGGAIEILENAAFEPKNETICVYQENLIYYSPSDNPGIHVYNLTTGKDKKISNERPTVLYLIDDRVFFYSGSQIKSIKY